MNKILAGLLGPLLLGACATTQAPDTALPWDAGVVRGTLPNGLEYRLVRDASQANRLDLRLTVQAGSVDEEADQVGVAHLVEHLTFYSHGSDAANLRERMTALGWVQGRHFNAVTNYDRTQYLLSPPSGVKQAPQALDALADLVFAMDYNAADLERERPVVIEEWRGGLGVAQRMNEQRIASQRVGSHYPAHRTIGNEAAIRNASLDALKRYQQRWYVPNNMVLSVVGDFEPSELARQIGQAFARPAAATLASREQRELPLDDRLKIFRLQDPQTGSNQVALLFRLHEPDSRGTTRAAMRERLLDRMTLAALQTSLRRQALTNGVRSLTPQKTLIGEHSTVLGIAAGVEGMQHRQALQQLLTEIERLRQHGFSEADAERESAVIRDLGAKTLGKEGARTFEQWVEQLNNAAVQGQPVVEKHAAAQRYLEVLPSIDREAMNQRLWRWIGSPDRVLQFSAPGLTPLALPTVAEVEEMQAAIANSSLSAPRDKVAQAESKPVAELVMPALPAPGRLAKRTTFAAEKVEHWQLGNGDRLVWLKANAEDGRWSLQAESTAGFNLADRPLWRTQMATQLATRGAPQGLSAEALESWRKAHKVGLGVEQKPQRLQVSLSVAPAEGALVDLLQSYRLSQLDMHIDPATFDASRQELLKRLQDRPDDVRAVEGASMRRLMYGQDSWHSPDAAALEALTSRQLESDWQRLSAAPVTYYLMADIDVRVLEEAVLARLANIPRGQALAPKVPLQKAGQRSESLAIALEPRAVFQASSYSEQAWSPQAAARVAALRDLASQQLKQRLRGEAAGVYRLKFESELNPDTGRIESRLSFTCDPARVDELWALARDTLAGLPQAVEGKWVESERVELLRQERKRRDDPQTQQRRLVLSERHWGDPRYLSQQARLPEGLTLEALKVTAGQLFPRANQVRQTLLPTPAAQEQAL
ncbi:insulinase family protein [Pseudomonas sp. 148P]|uniref:Insulinase family protein n=1 Tax=Pseudomonas ulcerans TaxID=3115852 RepID=A0ABU7I0A0_9PSED|nr:MULTISPECIES: insulinase family protein [unclassified Pseudomonas]MEE1921801.1 insulinase family protein [Pseudomonas sp. 147P]MEE1937098.1 insulinase family protein [Pseudomonas sp. 148P]